MRNMREEDRTEVVVIGAGQAGLSVGYHLKKANIPFVILERNARLGDTWRNRWDSLRLFTPAKYDGIVGMKFPAPPHSFPTKDEMGDYLETYAEKFRLPVRTGVTVERLWKRGNTFVVSTNVGDIEANQVVVAMATYQKPRLPDFAKALDPEIVQLHSLDYKNPGQLKKGSVLVVGAGNSGAEIGIELAKQGHTVSIAGNSTGEVPFRPSSFVGLNIMGPIVLRFVFHRLLRTDTPMGRKAMPAGLPKAGPLIRVKAKDLTAVGVSRVGKIVGVAKGQPVVDGGGALDVANVVWCTGFEPGFSWIDLPVFDSYGKPSHVRGVSDREAGLYFTGLPFLYAMSSTMIHGAERDAGYVATAVLSFAAAAPVKREPMVRIGAA